MCRGSSGHASKLRGVATIRANSVCSKPRTHRPKSLHSVYNHSAVKIPEGVTMSNLDNALRELREKRSYAQVEIEKLDQLISGIESLNGAGVSVLMIRRPP